MSSKALLNALLLALLVAPNLVTALVQLPLTRHFNHANAANILKHDQARARFMMTGKRSVSPFPITNQGTVYTAEFGVGNPPTSCKFGDLSILELMSTASFGQIPSSSTPEGDFSSSYVPLNVFIALQFKHLARS